LKRPELEEIRNMIYDSGPVPKLLPLSTLYFPPSDSYLVQFSE